MKLKSVQVRNFKCIEDSGRFDVCPVTCLVGKNEAGKTSLLEALHKLNPDVPELGEFDVLLEYPRRRRKEYQKRAATEPDDALITRWELEDKDVQAIQESLGSDVLPSRIVEVRKGYYPGRRWTFEDANLPQEALPASVQTAIERLLPKFLYFSKCNLLNGRVSIDDLIRNQERGKLSGPERVLLALLDLVGTKPQHLTSIENSEELIADLEAASSPITDKISRYWSQNTSLRVIFQLHQGKLQDPPPFDKGHVLETRILNTRHNLTLNFDERSTGFVWFFSFLVWFSQVRRTLGNNLFILLDDPGIGLHARAQDDLLRYISLELEPHYQAIYTTHSPFMVEPNKLARVRTVEDVVTTDNHGEELYLGTKVGDRTFSTNADTLIPLRVALGYELSRSMVKGQKTLLVESPADALYLNWFSKRLNAKGRTGLDPALKVVPCGGGEKISAFLGLFGAGEGDAIVLMDTTGVEQTPKSELATGCGILSTRNYSQTGEGSIEDMIGPQAYFALVNLCHKLPRKLRLPLTSAGLGEPTQRVVDRVEAHFAAHRSEIGTFDRYRPAEFLVENPRKCMRKLPDIAAALDRFERLFADVRVCRQIRREPAAPPTPLVQPRPIVEFESVKKADQPVEAERLS